MLGRFFMDQYLMLGRFDMESEPLAWKIHYGDRTSCLEDTSWSQHHLFGRYIIDKASLAWKIHHGVSIS